MMKDQPESRMPNAAIIPLHATPHLKAVHAEVVRGDVVALLKYWTRGIAGAIIRGVDCVICLPPIADVIVDVHGRSCFFVFRRDSWGLDRRNCFSGR